MLGTACVTNSYFCSRAQNLKIVCSVMQVQLGPFTQHGGASSSKSSKDKNRGNSVAIVIAPAFEKQDLNEVGYAERIRRAFRESKAKPEGEKVVNLIPPKPQAKKHQPSKPEKFAAKMHKHHQKH